MSSILLLAKFSKETMALMGYSCSEKKRNLYDFSLHIFFIDFIEYIFLYTFKSTVLETLADFKQLVQQIEQKSRNTHTFIVRK